MGRIRMGLSIGLVALLSLGVLTSVAGASRRGHVKRHHVKRHHRRGHSRLPVSPLAQNRPYRHGVVPKRGTAAATGLRAHITSSNNLNYGGGISDGTNTVGVTTGAPRVYIVLAGSQWGSQSGGFPNYSYSGDPSGMVPKLEGFFSGLGTGGEQWSGVMTQYCQDPSGQSCATSSKTHVGYPDGGALAGVWEDTSVSWASGSSPSAGQLGAEALKAAIQFGNTAAGSNRNNQYFILSPRGTHPDGFNTLFGNFCAWHDYTADSSLPGGAVSNPSVHDWVAFTNMPYVTDAGASCGSDFVNSASAGGNVDGVTIVGGHEYAETITDQYPSHGWTDSSGNENGDKCAWINSSTSGSTPQSVSQDITLNGTKFAVQSTWANDTGSCQVSEPIIRNGSSLTVTGQGNQTTTVGQAVTPVQMSAKEPDGSACGTNCTYAATGLPSGMSISPSGQITGTAPQTAGSTTVAVTATDANKVTGSTSFTWSFTADSAKTLTVTPNTPPSLPVGGSQQFSVSGTDQYGNAADVSFVSWGLSNSSLGSLSSSSGKTTKFTASAQGPETVTASLSGATPSSANVTIVAAPPNAVKNGDFELNSFSGWTASGASTAVMATSSTYPCDGSYCARLGTTTPTNGDSKIVQTFTAPSGSPMLSFNYYVVCPDTVTYDWATATLKDGTTTTTILSKTCTNTGRWVTLTKGLIAGHSYTLTLTSHDDNWASDPTYTLWDDVTVK